jgi:hypothetical protein
MVKGLDVFQEHFAAHSDQFITRLYRLVAGLHGPSSAEPAPNPHPTRRVQVIDFAGSPSTEWE